MNTSEYRLKYILVGASGSGKSTMGSILEQDLGLRRCVTSTTRPPREGERDGVEYHFKSHLDPNEMFEHACFGGYEYGITNDELTKGDFVILEPQGVDYYRRHYPAPLTVIQLMRDGIAVDPKRMARDKAAGFDDVHPDIIIRGETIEEMSANLLKAIGGRKPSLSEQINSAATRSAAKHPQKGGTIMTGNNYEERMGQGVGFERIRRITGYLVGTMDKWNDAKRAEERDRVKHNLSSDAMNR